ncbi:hypothetical protein ACFSTC_62910 [Nonomuraea ferruginea]
MAASGAGVVVVTGGSDFSSGADLATFSADVAAAIRGGRSSAGASAPDAERARRGGVGRCAPRAAA